MPSVVVIGGGPAGSTVATLLAQRGFSVKLYEADLFPRPHIGESLLPATIEILKLTGAAEAVSDAGFTVKNGATMVWGRDRQPWTWYFRETNSNQPHSFQVNRDEFDNILLKHADSCGVEVHQGIAVESISFAGAHATGVVVNGNAMACDFVIDASGQKTLAANQLHIKKWDEDFRNLAVYRYFSGGRHLTDDMSGNILVESVPAGWLWKIPLKKHCSSVGVVADRDTAMSEIRSSSIEAWFTKTIKEAPEIGSLLSNAKAVSDCEATRDWSYRALSLVGSTHCLVGDAACFIDPLFSTGVHLAIFSAFLAAAYVTTVFRNPALTVKAGNAFESQYLTQYSHFRELARLFYASNQSVDSYFWEARRITGETNYTPRHAFVRAISGQAVVGYERATLAHGVLPSSLTDAIDSIESGRKARQQEIASQFSPTRKLVLNHSVQVKKKALLGVDQYVEGYVIERTESTDLEISEFVAIVVDSLKEQPRSIDEIVQSLIGSGLNEQTVNTSLLPTCQLLLLEEILQFGS